MKAVLDTMRPWHREANGIHRVGNGAFDLVGRNAIMADHESNVRHVLRIVAAHHLGEDQVQGGGAEQTQPAHRQTSDWNEMLFPISTQENLVGSEKVSDVKAFGA